MTIFATGLHMNKSFPASLCEPDGTFIGYFSIAVGQTAIRTEQLQGWHHLLIVYFQGHRSGGVSIRVSKEILLPLNVHWCHRSFRHVRADFKKRLKKLRVWNCVEKLSTSSTDLVSCVDSRAQPAPRWVLQPVVVQVVMNERWRS